MGLSIELCPGSRFLRVGSDPMVRHIGMWFLARRIRVGGAEQNMGLNDPRLSYLFGDPQKNLGVLLITWFWVLFDPRSECRIALVSMKRMTSISFALKV